MGLCNDLKGDTEVIFLTECNAVGAEINECPSRVKPGGAKEAISLQVRHNPSLAGELYGGQVTVPVQAIYIEYKGSIAFT